MYWKFLRLCWRCPKALEGRKTRSVRMPYLLWCESTLLPSRTGLRYISPPLPLLRFLGVVPERVERVDRLDVLCVYSCGNLSCRGRGCTTVVCKRIRWSGKVCLCWAVVYTTMCRFRLLVTTITIGGSVNNTCGTLAVIALLPPPIMVPPPPNFLRRRTLLHA